LNKGIGMVRAVLTAAIILTSRAQSPKQ
jgi:hypothetical protein